MYENLIRTTLGCAVVTLCAAAGAVCAQESRPASPVPFQTHRIGDVRGEALCVADFNNDGRLDILAGSHLYLAPDWKGTAVRLLEGSVDEQGIGYFDDFVNLALDVDEDGQTDVVSACWFAQCMRWCRNTGTTGGATWTEHEIEVGGHCEGGELGDLDGDGRAREVLADSALTAWYEPAPDSSGGTRWVRHLICEKPMTYGVGMGDINGDQRLDVLRPNAWFEAPADPRAGNWVEHAWALGAPGGQADHTPVILVEDVNGDGLADVITSSAHKHGIFWYEQTTGSDGVPVWTQHTIDDTWSQAHSLTLADLDGDGVRDLVAGKRFMAHNGQDPDAFGPLCVYWYRLERAPSPRWTRYTLSEGEGIGSGVTAWSGDLDADGDNDVVVTGKWGGPVWFENRRVAGSQATVPAP